MYFDDINGTIVGGNFGECWLTYNNKIQGQIMYPSNRIEAHKMCNQKFDQIKSECLEVFKIIYPLDKWEFNYRCV